VAQTLKEFKKEVDALMDKGEKKEIAILHVLRNYIRDSKKIRFEGDNYSEEWAKEAEKRGLSNFKTTPEALDAYVSESAKNLFFSNNIFSERELDARHEIMLEEYVKKVQIEARILGYLATNHVLPAAIEYQNKLVQNIAGLKSIGLPEESYKTQKNLAGVISGHIQKINDNVEAMIEARKQANEEGSMHSRAEAYCNDVKSYFDEIRYHADKLELVIEDKLWPLPKYRELLFLR
jgi:glutamine synthetase